MNFRIARLAPRRRWLAACALLLADLSLAGDPIALRNGTVAGGGHIVTQGQFVLIGTIAEPVQGVTAQGSFRITSGFPATIGQPAADGGRIFADGFED
jgi:hypothetical protein